MSRLLAALAALTLAAVAESTLYGLDDPARWLPDAAAGLSLCLAALVTVPRPPARPGAALLGLAGVTWFAGNFDGDLLYVHRGFAVHLLLAYPAATPRTRLDAAAIAGGYAAAWITPVWASDGATIALVGALLAVAAIGHRRAAGRVRRLRLTALGLTALFALVLASGAAARLTVPDANAVEPTLLAYEAALMVIALVAAARLGGPAADAIADLVVELGEAPGGALRDRLARAVGDPDLALGYWSPDAGTYVDATGAPVALDPSRTATRIQRDGAPFAVVVHDRSALRDPALVAAVAAATRLTESNVALRREVEDSATTLRAARRRLLTAADAEREALEARVRAGPQRRLEGLPLEGRARELRDGTLADLRELAQGLHPRELAAGLPGALTALADRMPAAVTVDTAALRRATPEIEATAYFVCAEAMANAVKHAPGSAVLVTAGSDDGQLRLVIADDGPGGAELASGTGLQGLADRVEALGGDLRIESQPGGGTRITASLPVL